MPRVHAYGYARNINEMETAKSEAVQSLRENLAKPYRIWLSTGSTPGDGRYLPPLPRHEPDPPGLTFTLYRHGGLNLQVDYEFEYPEPVDPSPTAPESPTDQAGTTGTENHLNRMESEL